MTTLNSVFGLCATITGALKSLRDLIASRAIVAVAVGAVSLTGCSNSSNILANGDSAGPQTALATPSAVPGQAATIEIAPVIGAPDNVSQDIQTQLAAALQGNRISVAPAGSKGQYTLRGYIVAAREKTGSKISYIWDVTDAGGKRANRITGEEFAAGTGKDPWAAVTPGVVQNIANKTAQQIAAWMPTTSGSVPVASTTPVAAPSNVAAATPPTSLTAAASAQTTGSINNGPVSTLVPPVTGAPGDGSATLTRAIQRELTSKGVSLVNAPGGQTYRVEGKVAMGQGKDGKQPIQIDWSVIDPAGKKLGTVSQKNEVPQGSLDGAWGKTADAAAAAAAQGILKLLPQQSATN